MKFYDIEEDHRVYPGEYLLYKPKMAVVLCGAFLRSENKVKAMLDGRLFEAPITDFQKISLTGREHRERKMSRCKGCSK
tara:strand:+ start:695 stop:931 length:237 start_codon:yes stop_codon:yes gene_type:complete